MDWANDRLGNLVHATVKGVFSYGFSCPTCGEPVRRRAGLERRPHFAHYSHSAKPDCENYHPSSGQALAIAARVWEVEHRPAGLDAQSVPGGVFLERSEGGRFTLTLKLPRLRTDIDVSGQVQIRSGLGIRTYSATQLHRPQFVPVVPQIPLVQVTATDELSGAAAAIEDDISFFRQSGNVFRAGDDAGRLLAPEEPLEWGESYRLLTLSPLGPAPAELTCRLLASGGKQWFIYEFDLPSAKEGLLPQGSDVISRFLGRAIRHKSARVFLIYPPPHHIDVDGTYVYPSFPERLIFRRSGACELSIEGDARTEETSLEESGEWLAISKLHNGELQILADRRLHAAARTGECRLFRPGGVQALIGELSLEIFQTELAQVLERELPRGLAIQCPTVRVLEEIEVAKDEWKQKGTQLLHSGASLRVDVDAHNFGSLKWPPEVVAEAAIEQRPQMSDEMRTIKTWLMGVLARSVGGDVPRYLRDPSLVARDIPWLLPYVAVEAQEAGSD